MYIDRLIDVAYMRRCIFLSSHRLIQAEKNIKRRGRERQTDSQSERETDLTKVRQKKERGKGRQSMAPHPRRSVCCTGVFLRMCVKVIRKNHIT